MAPPDLSGLRWGPDEGGGGKALPDLLLGSSQVLLQLPTPEKVEKSMNFPELSLQSFLIFPAPKSGRH